MSAPDVRFSEQRDIPVKKLVALYEANGWSSAKKPMLLQKALSNSSTLVSAWIGDELIGIGNAITDGYLVVYYPHMLVHPKYQGKGIGSEMMKRIVDKYKGFHQHMLVADGRAIEFYKKCGFTQAGKTQSMWIYDGEDH